MLGIIVGVFSVVVTVSIGVGIRQQIVSQIKELGPDLITILPGSPASNEGSSLFNRINILPASGGGSLSEKDLTLIGNAKNVNMVVPLTSITGSVEVNNIQHDNEQIIATSDGFPSMVNQTLAYGQFFNASDVDQNEAVLGQNVAQRLFNDPIPIGRSFKINNQTFQVQGVLSQFDASPLTPISNYNNAIFIPFSVGSQMSGNQPQIYEIFAKPYSLDQTDTAASSINSTLLKAHGGQNNFTVLKQQQALKLANNTLNVLTALIATVAAVSLIVGGIGIMNIMFASVIERHKEIGIRKSIGATNKQILSQFVIEAGLIGLIGGFIGVLMAVLADLALSYFTTLRPAITWQIIVLSVGAALLAGVVFGLMPAYRASHRDPIESLRHE